MFYCFVVGFLIYYLKFVLCVYICFLVVFYGYFNLFFLREMLVWKIFISSSYVDYVCFIESGFWFVDWGGGVLVFGFCLFLLGVLVWFLLWILVVLYDKML